MEVSGNAVRAAQKAYRECEGDSTESHRAALTAALPFLPVQGAGKADTLKLIERMAFGYEVMFEKLCHISGTSGVAQSWYRSKAREATERLSPLHSITTESNKSVPGDCKRQYQDFMSRILSALEPSAARELALEGAYTRLSKFASSAATGIDIVGEILVVYDAAPGHPQWQRVVIRELAEDIKVVLRSLSSPDHADAGKVEGDGVVAYRFKHRNDGPHMWEYYPLPIEERSTSPDFVTQALTLKKLLAILNSDQHADRQFPSAPASEGAE